MDRLQPARSGARTSRARVVHLLPRESVQWRDRVCAHANSVCSLQAAAGMSEHGRASRERAVPLAQWPIIEHGRTPTSAERHTHVISARGAPPPERVRAVARSRVRTRELRLFVGAAADMSKHGRAQREMALPLAQWAFIWHGPTPTSAARRAHVASTCAALPPERERERARSGTFFYCAHAQVSCSLEAAADMSEHGRSLSEMAVSLAQ